MASSKKKQWLGWILSKDKLDEKQKINFSFSLYGGSSQDYKQLDALAKEIKKELKTRGLKARYVSSQKSALSSVIVKKNNLLGQELLIIKEKDGYLLGLTEAVQDFAAYSLRDYKRPDRDQVSGMLPPKLAQIMINLASQGKKDKTILDPFCGSGTILQEALLLGFDKIYGTDISAKAVADSQANILWLAKQQNISAKVVIKKADVSDLASIFDEQSIDLIVSEPFMGDARFIKHQDKIAPLEKIKSELQNLYLSAFEQFGKIIKNQGKVVFIFPLFAIKEKNINTLDILTISALGWRCLESDLLYSRPEQKVKRQITIWQKIA
ncbi:MAG: methyltransferase domain-containing protein [Patescibacteria group bacterium]|nr:methyltransferase domain-containing protein [Patescibacteria group bacterium]